MTFEVIKMETIKDEDGNEKVVWTYADGSVGATIECGPIVGPYNYHTQVFSSTPEWAKVDKDNNLVHLDIDLCAQGPANAYTALGIGIWNAAIEKAAEEFDCNDDFYYDEIRESILRLKK